MHCFGEASRLAPDDYRILNRIAITSLELKRPNIGLPAIQKLVSQIPSHPELRPKEPGLRALAQKLRSVQDPHPDRDRAVALAWLKSATAMAAVIRQQGSRLYALDAIVEADIAAGDLSEAQNTARLADDPFGRAYHAIAKEQAARGDIQGARLTIAAMPESARFRAYMDAGKSAWAKGDNTGAYALLARNLEMLEADGNNSQSPEVYDLLQVFAAVRDVRIAEGLLKILKRRCGSKGESDCYYVGAACMHIVEAQVSVGQVNAARLTAFGAGKDRDGVLYWTAVQQATRHDLDGAVETCAAIASHEYKASAYSDIAVQCHKVGDAARAKMFSTRSMEEALLESDVRSKVWSLISSAFAASDCGRKGEAVRAFATALSACSTLTAEDKCKCLLGIADGEAVSGLPVEAAECYLLAARAARESERGESSLRYTVYRMAERGFFPQARAAAADLPQQARWSEYESISVSQARAGDLAGAEETIARIPSTDVDDREIAFATMVEEYSRRGQIQAAQHAMGLIGVTSPASLERRGRAARSVAAAIGEAGDQGQLTSWIRSLDEPEVRTYAQIGAAEGWLHVPPWPRLPTTK